MSAELIRTAEAFFSFWFGVWLTIIGIGDGSLIVEAARRIAGWKRGERPWREPTMYSAALLLGVGLAGVAIAINAMRLRPAMLLMGVGVYCCLSSLLRWNTPVERGAAWLLTAGWARIATAAAGIVLLGLTAWLMAMV